MAKKPSRPAKKASRKLKAKHRPKARNAGATKRSSRKSAGPAKRKQKLAKKPAARKPATRVRGKASSKAPRAAAPKGKGTKHVAPKVPPKAAKLAQKPALATAKAPAKQPLPARGAAGVPGKPSAGEIAARLSARRTEKALAEGKARSGKNGGVELRKLELTPAEAEARKTRLKNLIVLGKERSYLTYAEINDHLPDDILDAEQIEGIISMINDMGIQVYDEAPDAETLLMSEAAPSTAAEDVDEEAAEAAASTLDSEFGRTTDPVRMYMREMGSVELLTREGEIEIAKRIEEGLKHMIMAISACPMTVAQILELAAKIEKDEEDR